MIFLVVLSLLLAVVGLAGCILPGIPGPPLSFIALVLLSIARKGQAFSTNFLLIMALITVGAMVLDFLSPGIGARRFGSTRYGFWGAIAGMILGIFWAPPLGIFVGAAVGALIGETIAGQRGVDVLKASGGVLIGIMVGTLIKLTASGVMTYYYFKALF
jgi:uncharacterized protein YqgC (DUF456 family)